MGGYAWAANVDVGTKTIHLDVYILMSASRIIPLEDGQQAQVVMTSEMPWEGSAKLTFSAPDGWRWSANLPMAEYAVNPKVCPQPRRFGPASLRRLTSVA